MTVTTPEIYPAIVHMALPYAPLMDAVQYELEECVRRQSFARRYSMSIEEALSDAPAEIGIVAGTVGRRSVCSGSSVVNETRRDSNRH